MKSVSIVYKRPTTDSIAPQFRPVKSIKRSVDQYLQKLKQKQQTHHNTKTFTISIRPNINTAQTSRQIKYLQKNQITNTMNIAKIKYSTQNIFKHMNDHHQNIPIKRQIKFRSTFVKKNTHQGFYSLKGIKLNNHQLFTQNQPNFNIKRNPSQHKNTSKLVTLKKIKLIKPKTVLISVDFILNEFNFWTEQKVDETAHKNWKILQEYSNIVWLTRRQNSFRKLQKYAREYGLRLDGVYKIQPNKKSKTLLFSLSTFEKDFMSDTDFIRKEDVRREIILINSLKVETIKNIGYEEFYNLFPVSNLLRSVVHFVQIDMNDKHRFNSPLKILSKEKLPHPNQINHLFLQYYRDHKRLQSSSGTKELNKGQGHDQQEQVKDEQIMWKYEQIKERFLNYFGNHLRLNLSSKVKVDDIEQSLQYLIGDMLKRNFNLLSNYQQESQKISIKLQKIKHKQIQTHKISDLSKQNKVRQQDNFIKTNTRLSIDKLLTSKLIYHKPQHQLKQKYQMNVQQQKVYFKDPVFLWRK